MCFFLFWYIPIYIKVRNGQTLAKIQVFLLRGTVYMAIYGSQLTNDASSTCNAVWMFSISVCTDTVDVIWP